MHSPVNIVYMFVHHSLEFCQSDQNYNLAIVNSVEPSLCMHLNINV